MKFTKEQAYETIVAKLTPNGETLSLSARSINDQLETLIPLLANEETELDAFVTSCFPIFKTANANVNNDVSNGINKYKEEHPVQKPTPKTTPNPPAQDDTTKTLETRLAEMEARLAERDKSEKIQSKKNQLIQKLTEKGVKDSEWISALTAEIQISEDLDVDAKCEKLVKLYNKSQANIPLEVNTPYNAGQGGAESRIEKVISAAAEYAKAQRL